MRCCFPKKLLSRNRREDRYKVTEEDDEKRSKIVNQAAPALTSEESEQQQQPNAPPPQFSWDVREAVDISQYTVADIHNDIHRRDGSNKDSMQIENCTEASIFLLKPTASLTVDDCRDCLLILGPCSGSLFIRDCSNCTILASCQQLRTRDCHDIRIAVLCPTQPIIENSDDIHFHPLTLFYDDLKNQMREASLSLFTNRVKSVHDFTPEGGKRNYSIHASQINLSSQQIETILKNGIKIDEKSSLLPVFTSTASSIQQPSKYIYSHREVDESLDDFNERCCAFTDILKTSELKLIESYDIETKNIDQKMLPMQGNNMENLIVFEVLGKLEEISKVCRESFDLFKIVDDGVVDQLKALILASESKND